ncbi:MAG: hypothetical protein JW974_00775 [Alphaproteobacteria bacterium]|nr:hypothetical protein [Alphaproteobacteria bacterium]MBN2674979.1 hypothetical protein [Alphaproteobacteria bacterium]
MKFYRIIFSLILTFGIVNFAVADNFRDCMQKINDPINNSGFFEGMDSIFPDKQDLTQEIVTKKAPKIYNLLAANILAYCADYIAEFSELETGKISFARNNKKIAFEFSIKKLFEHINLRTAIMVYNDRSKVTGDVIKLSDIGKTYWSDECSDLSIWDNLDDDAAVNQAGQRVFSSYGGSKNEFFLDFEEGNNRRAFPGLVLMDKTGSTTEKIVTFSNILTGKEKTKQFADSLQNSMCSNQGLAVYLVGIDTFPDPRNKNSYAIAAGVTGGTMALLGLGSALATTTAVAATGSMILVNTTLGLAAASSAVPVAGWIAAAVLTTTAGIIAMVPQDLQDIQQVMVLDGPYNIQ